jgi:FkbM family methyltransferase
MSLADRIISALRPWQFRGKGRLLRWLLPDSGTRQSHIFGYRVELDLGDLIQRMIYLGTYEREETRLVWRYLQPGMTFVDVGANIGYYSLMAARRVGVRGCVFAFEPSSYASGRLEQTVRTNGLAHLRVIPSALGSHRGTANLLTPLPGNHSPSMLGTVGPTAVSVPITTLDTWLAEWQVNTVHLLKIDVEGYEPQVLSGASAALAAGRVQAILCELNDPWLRQAGIDSQTLYNRILQAGFRDCRGDPPPLAGRVLTRFLIHRSAARQS